MTRQHWLSILAIVVLLGSTSLAVAQAKKPTKVAVLIGTNDYTDATLPGLKYCEKDMLKLKETLEPLGFKVVLLLGSGTGDAEATRQNILDALANDAETNKKYAFRDIVNKEDIAMVAFSGHGQQIPVKKDGKELEVPFYCPKRAKSGVPQTLISLNDVLEKLNGGKANSLLLVDACRKFTERKDLDGTKSAKGLSLDRSVINDLRKNVGGMFACDDRQEALEHEIAGGGHGLFFFSVIESIRTAPKDDDGVVTWEELVPKIRKRVETLTTKVPGLAERDRQTPQSFGNFTSAVVVVPRDAVAVPDKEPKAGEEREFEIAKGVKMRFCWVPAGKATLGSPKDEKGRGDDEMEHEFTTKGYWLGKYEVTQGEWEAVMGDNPSYFSKNGFGKERVAGLETNRFPVEDVSWEDCQKFLAKCAWKSLRLPHEDEWEYAARGGKGNKQAFYWGDSSNGEKANYDGTKPYGTTTAGPYLERPTVVGSYEKVAPHPWGLCDMVGNVREWCDNWYSRDRETRVLRGGSWHLNPLYCRVAKRNCFQPVDRDNNYGFRVCFRVD